MLWLVHSDQNVSDISHYGVLGMKWGVRRYQNYDGSYTQRGVTRYRKAESEYNAAKAKKKSAKSTGDKPGSKKASGEMKIAKRSMEKAYKGLKKDKLADQGKELYKSGKTITSNAQKHQIIQGGIVVTSAVLSRMNSNRYVKNPRQLAAVVAAGGTAVNAVLTGKEYYENKRLRAYYAH